MKYLIDSDYVVDYLKGQQAAQFLETLLSDGVAISIITLTEVYEGIYYGHNPTYYERTFRRFLRGVRVLGINRSIAYHSAHIRGDLRARGLLIPPADIFIAATALHYKLTLITRNRKDYQRISGISLYPV